MIGAVGLLLAMLGGGAYLAHSHPPGTPGPRWLEPERWLGVLGLSPDLPSDFAIHRDDVPAKAGVPQIPGIDLSAPLGQLSCPFKQEQAAQAWQLQRDGRTLEAAERAEVAWKLYDAPQPSARGEGQQGGAVQAADSTATDNHSPTDRALAGSAMANERVLFSIMLAQLRMAAGDRSGALAAARLAVRDPALGPAALNFLVDKADDQGLYPVVIALTKDRQEPALRVLRIRALRRTGQADTALTEAESLQVPKGTRLWRQATLERLRALAAKGRQDDATALARQLIGGGKTSEAEEAVDFLIGSSDASWQARIGKGKEEGAAALEALIFTAQRRRYPRAIAGLMTLAEDKNASLAVRCHARSWAAKAHDRKAEFDKANAIYAAWPATCDNAAVRALEVDEDPLTPAIIAMRHGRDVLLQGRLEGSKYLEQAVELGIDGVEGDDARLLLSLVKMNNAADLLKQHGIVAAQDYAERDIVDVVGWRFAMESMVAGKWKEALPILDRLVQARDADPTPTAASKGRVRYDDRDWARGRADYFAGRALQALGQSQAAAQRWQRVVARHPLSYYAALSHAQLQAAGISESLTQGEETMGPQTDSATLSKPGVQRARLLGLLGLHQQASDELDAQGLGRDTSAEQKWATGDPGGTWTRAALDDEAGRWVASHAIGRDSLRRFATVYPSEANHLAWEIAYPRAYRSLFEAAAKEFKLHPSVVWAIGRSESGFNPKVESHAAAIGLLQLILPTAQAMAKPLGLTADAQTLRQPAVNVRLGARYLKLLMDRFDREPQMAAGYNAGGGAVGRWRKQRGDWPMDLFVEAIPFRETRDYAKRVTSAIAIYRNLYDHEQFHTFALNQRPIPVQDEAPTEPSSTASGTHRDAGTEAAQKLAAPTLTSTIRVGEVAVPGAKKHGQPRAAKAAQENVIHGHVQGHAVATAHRVPAARRSRHAPSADNHGAKPSEPAPAKAPHGKPANKKTHSAKQASGGHARAPTPSRRSHG